MRGLCRECYIRSCYMQFGHRRVKAAGASPGKVGEVMSIKLCRHNPLFRSAPQHQTTLQRMERNDAYESPLICWKCHKDKVFLRGLCRGWNSQFG